MTPFDPAELPAAPPMAIPSTSPPDGPRDAPARRHPEHDALRMLPGEGVSSARRGKPDPRRAVEVVGRDDDARPPRHLGPRGRAEIPTSEADRSRRLLARPLAPDPAGSNARLVREIARVGEPAGRMVRLAPDRVLADDAGFFRTGARPAAVPA